MTGQEEPLGQLASRQPASQPASQPGFPGPASQLASQPPCLQIASILIKTGSLLGVLKRWRKGMG